MDRCSFGDGVIAMWGGIPVEPCIYEDIEIYKNATVVVSRCKICGRQKIGWKRQEDTEEITDEDNA